MELNEFAEIILFGQNINSDKLLKPINLTDNKKYKAITAPKSPGRPAELKVRDDSAIKKTKFPNREQIYRNEQRGYILHFFANHELLAMEIMALVLLKFPEAPKTFRMGIAKTILEEQNHLSLYIERMHQLGVSFGEIPVNSFFWNCLSSLQSPFEFVTQMSMTFEQANLDYSLFYKNLMLKVEDLITASILEQVYLEEIGHVKHGVSWFHKWKDPNVSDWDAYTNALKYPLTPARAKGILFDEAGRKKSGLTDNYIKKLSLFSTSKGRPPSILFFNPDCEKEIARKNIGFTPSSTIKNLKNDCSSLMQFVASKEDVVLVERIPGNDFLSKIQACGFAIPEWQLVQDNKIILKKFLHNYVSSLKPWGWSPESIAFLKLFKPKMISKSEFQNNIFNEDFFNNNIKIIYSKIYSLEVLNKLLNHFENFRNIFPSPDQLPKIAFCYDSAIKIISDFFSTNNYSFIVIKAPYGCSGQNMKKVRSCDLTKSESNWIKKILKEQNSLIIEPWFNKVSDLSYQSKITELKEIINIGSTEFLTNQNGQYKGTFVGSKKFHHSLNYKKFFYNNFNNTNGIEEILKAVSTFVGANLLQTNFEGPFGIDAFIYEDKNSTYGYRIKPLCEINPRITMGRVALEISKRIQTGTFAIWVHLRISDILNANFTNISDFIACIEKICPIILDSNTSNTPLIKEGILFTNEALTAKSVLTTLIVGKNVLDTFTSTTGIKIIN